MSSSYVPPTANAIADDGLPSCPLIILASGQQSQQQIQQQALLVQGMCFQVDMNVSVAMVTITGQCFNHLGKGGLGVLLVPLQSDSVVTEARVIINDKRIIETQVIPIEEAQKHAKENQKNEQFSEFSKYNPKLFRLPLTNIEQGDTVKFGITYLQPLIFKPTTGNYEFDLPMSLPANLFPPAIQGPEAILDIFVNINAGTTNVKWGCTSHPMKIVQSGPHFMQLALDKNQVPNWKRSNNKSFSITYSAWSPEILTTLFVQPANANDADERGSFLLFVAPPGPVDPSTIQIPRSVVFLLDRSGSMSGDPILKAKEALRLSLFNLRPIDTFTIVAFDDKMEFFAPSLLSVNQDTITQAQQWLSNIDARGGTDILSPVTWSLNLLENSNGMPFTFLITDGAVSNEKEICNVVKARNSKARISTFGIGSYCNGYFLKMLATIGRGFFEVALDSENLTEKMARMFISLNAPVLTDVEIGLQNVSNVEIYPFPIQDLFLGAPLVVSGKFSGSFPSELVVRGNQVGGTQWQGVATALTNSNIPVAKVFVRQQLDLLVAKAWLTDDVKFEKEAIALSVSQSIPSPYTTMVAYETTPQRKQEAKKKKSGLSTSGKVAVGAVAVGGVVLIGCAAMGFGDVGATLSNLSVGSAMSAVGDIGHVMGNIFGGIGNVGGEVLHGIGNVGGEVLHGIGNVGGEVLHGIGNVAGEVGHGIGGVVQHVDVGCCGDICHGISGCCGDVCQIIPDICHVLCQVLASCDL